MRRLFLFFALAVGLLTSASTLQAQTVNLSRYITLTVAKDSAIMLDFRAAASATPVRIVSGSNTQNITVGTDWYNGSTPSTYTVTAANTTMTVYGDITAFRCQQNGENLTALDPSHNKQLTELTCGSNEISSLDVSKNTQLTELTCGSNEISSLDVSKNTQLTKLNCSYNNLNSLDVSHNTQLDKLDCSGNKLTSLDLSKNTELTTLHCSHNNLTTLDLSNNTELVGLVCYTNNLTTLDLSSNTQLTTLYCHANNFSTQALDDIYCALPDRTGNTNGVIQPVKNASDPNHATVLATNKQNAIAKKWKVQYFDGNADIPATTGSYVCSGGGGGSEPNMSRYITLTVASGQAIELDFWAAADGTPIRIVSGSNTQNITVGTGWKGTATYTADGTEMKVYGNLTGFNCSYNGALIALDASNNTQLKWLHCSHNQLLTTLDVSNNTQLTKLYCHFNDLTTLDVSHNTQLKDLDCSYNRITALDVSKNTQLESLYCYTNNLRSLDVSLNTKLQKLICHGNLFNTAALDAIYCALPDRTDTTNGVIQPLENPSDQNHTTVIATNKANATAKNWKVLYYIGDTDIPATTGTYECSATTDIAEATAEPTLTLYPNPVADVLYLSATARTIRIYNIYGTEVAHATDTDRVEVSHLPAGVYTVRADGTVAKMVKR